MARPFWTNDALQDLESIRDYIRDSSPGYAGPFLVRLVESVEVLDLFPLIGARPEFTGDDRREIIFQNYRIVYRVVDGRPWIVLVVHAAVDLWTELRRRRSEGD